MKVHGMASVRDALNNMPMRIQKNAVGAGTQAVGTALAKKARANAHSHGGGLARHAKEIVVRKVGRRSKRLVGFASRFGVLAFLFEFGSAERVRDKGGSTGRMAMQPFLRPAVERTTAITVEMIFAKAAGRRMERDAAKGVK